MPGKTVYKVSSTESITIEDGVLSSTVDKEGNELYAAAMDGMESILLALHCEGIEVPKSVIDTATDAIANNYGDE